MIRMKCNCCDGIFKTLDVHFTKVCDNDCAHCVDKISQGLPFTTKPKVKEICDSIIERKDKVKDVLFLGGEPCLYLDELLECVTILRKETNLKLYATTSLPKICYDDKEKFWKLIESLDALNISVQHYDEKIADSIRRTESKYDRQGFYKEIGKRYPNRIRICMNLVKGALDSKSTIINALNHYRGMGFKSMKLSEIQNYTEYWVSFEKIFGIKLPSPYSHGCQKPINPKLLDESFDDFELILRRSCFVGNRMLKASFGDLMKSFFKIFEGKPDCYSGIIYEDGSYHRGWI